MAVETAAVPARTSLLALWLIFLRLGLTSFGGPVAHLAYFREAFVTRRRWLDERSYLDLVALCQFLPGPASSQVGFAIGLSRRGLAGGLLAWLGFTLPSALALAALALAASSLGGPATDRAVYGLKLATVAIVAHAVWGMARPLAADLWRVLIGLIALGLVLAVSGVLGQYAAIGLGAGLGLVLCRQVRTDQTPQLSFMVSPRLGHMALAAFALLLIGLPVAVAVTQDRGLAVFDGFYRSGALVFGGGHVVLPMLKAAVIDPGWVSTNDFLVGYGLAQAMPGPLFTVSAYLGAVMSAPPNGLIGALIAVVAIFLPGLLLLLGVLPVWDRLRTQNKAQAVMLGVNAAVVGLLAAALIDPVWTGAVTSWRDAAIAVIGFLAVTFAKAPAWSLVLVFALGSVVLAY
jgi:chromate transporter